MALALALLVVGGMALVNALTSEAAAPGPSATTSEPTTATRQAPTQSGTSTVLPLTVRVTGAATKVFVRVAGGGAILQDDVIPSGESRQYDEAPLDVVVSDSGAVEIRIYGVLQKNGASGVRRQYQVPKK